MLSDEPDRLPILGSGLSCARALPAGLSGPSPSSAGPVGRKDWKSNAAKGFRLFKQFCCVLPTSILDTVSLTVLSSHCKLIRIPMILERLSFFFAV